MTTTQEIHDSNTRAFIDENPSEVVVHRRVRQKTSAGGFVWQVTALLPPQTMRKVSAGRVGAVVSRTTEDGRTVVPTYTMIGVANADIQRGDLAEIGEDNFEVVWVNRSPGWACRAEVIGHG